MKRMSRERSVLLALLLTFVALLSAGSGLYAGASFFAPLADLTITTTVFTTTTSWTTSIIWSTVAQTVEGILTTVTYATSTSTATVTGALLIDSYGESNRDNQQGIRSSGPTESGQAIASHAQSFTISSIKFLLAKVGSPTGTINAKVYACTGIPGSTGKPTGAALGTSAGIDVSTLSTSWTLVEFAFPTPVSIAAGANYCISASFAGGNVNNDVKTGLDGSSPAHPGNWFYGTGSYTASTSYDMIFYVYGNWA